LVVSLVVTILLPQLYGFFQKINGIPVVVDDGLRVFIGKGTDAPIDGIKIPTGFKLDAIRFNGSSGKKVCNIKRKRHISVTSDLRGFENLGGLVWNECRLDCDYEVQDLSRKEPYRVRMSRTVPPCED
jgi:hypothetical protein